MERNDKIQLFENKRIRTAWDEDQEEWYFSVVDVVAPLTGSTAPSAYWRKLKQRKKRKERKGPFCHNPFLSDSFNEQIHQFC